MKRLLSAIAALAVAFAVLPSGVGSAATSRAASPECGSASDQQAAIREFVQLTSDKLKINIKEENYEVQVDGANCIVKPRGSAPVTSKTVTDALGNKTITVSTSTTHVPDLSGGGVATIQQDTKWYEPTCIGPYEDETQIGIMNPLCLQWGDMRYENATRDNYVFRMYATCGARKGGPELSQVYACSVEAGQSGGSSPELLLTDYNPKGTLSLPNCQSIPLNITAGPVSAGTAVTTCERLALIKSPAPVNPWMEVAWQGKSYWEADKREVGFLLGISTARGSNAGVTVGWDMKVGPCSLAGVPYPTCAF
ncbi:hypothetical protein GCM10009733_086990 [Nonomuraea maheshkhaliensis]|uniref:Ig-like domain-containing protein n=1 Tax=Nonomuraea maheshkhaliensis TaxID=419590 RepID=A0ABP4SQQ5_9ACTN